MKNRSSIDEQIANKASDQAAKLTAAKISDLSEAEVEAVSGGYYSTTRSEVS